MNQLHLWARSGLDNRATAFLRQPEKPARLDVTHWYMILVDGGATLLERGKLSHDVDAQLDGLLAELDTLSLQERQDVGILLFQCWRMFERLRELGAWEWAKHQ